MKRLLSSIAIIFSLAFAFVGCDGNDYSYNLEEVSTNTPQTSVYVNGVQMSAPRITRSANVNSNEWGYRPLEITQSEIDAVKSAFENGNYSIVDLSEWSDFYVQHVFKGHGNMDNICLNATNEHVNNFNATSGSVMLMENSSASNFSYFNSLDSKRHYEAMVVAIPNYGYYVGFDFLANGQNPNQKEEKDGVYTDWIIKVTKAINKNAIIDIPTQPSDDKETVEGEIEYDIHQQLHKDWDEIKTSVHVRAVSGVTITIPIEKEYIVEQDDFAIRVFNKYFDIEVSESSKALVNELNITVQVQHNDDAVVITIPTLSKDALDAIKKTNFGDGLTFEIHTYTTNIDRKAVWEKLKNTKIECGNKPERLYGQITSAIYE